jgi:hypothetical protein
VRASYKRRVTGTFDHLGDLATIWLYGDDHQIKGVSYREIEAGETGCTVTVRPLAR